MALSIGELPFRDSLVLPCSTDCADAIRTAFPVVVPIKAYLAVVAVAGV